MKYPLIPPSERLCKRCNIIKPIDEFPLQNTTRKGMTWKSYRHSCKKCESARCVGIQKRNREAGNCPCGRPRSTKSKLFCETCIEGRARRAPTYLPTKRVQDTARRLEIKKKVFSYYGDKCACCCDTTFEFLSIDHVGGWGKDHLNPQGNRYGGNALYTWIIKNNFPEGFRLLCGSCHYAVSYHGYCPHGNLDAAMLQSNEASISDPVT